MKKRNKHMGSSLEDFLKEEGILARRTNTSRAFDLLLYPGNALNRNPLDFIERNLILPAGRKASSFAGSRGWRCAARLQACPCSSGTR